MALSGRVALVTGSTSGIGKSVSEHLSRQGCSIIVTGSRSEEAAAHTIDHIRQSSSAEIHYIQCDLNDKTEIDVLCNKIGKIYPDGIDILVNNAGIVHQAVPVTELSFEHWNRQINVNLTAPFLLIKHFVPFMKERKWGRIINMSSVAGAVAVPDCAEYVSSKHGLVGLSKAVALETAEQGITCNAIIAGMADTPMLQGFIKKSEEKLGLPPEQTWDIFRSKIPTRKIMTTTEIAEYAMFLCSPAADNMTGTAVPIDGGYIAQ